MKNLEAPLKELFSLQKLVTIVEKWRMKGLTVVMCHGCFDPLHYGHLLHFREARTFGDKLIVTVTSDQYVEKGESRPMFSDIQRTDMINSLKIIDGVAISNYPTAIPAIQIIRPNIYTKGIDYDHENIDHRFRKEMQTVSECGGIVRITRTIKYSSTNLLQTMKLIEKLS